MEQSRKTRNDITRELDASRNRYERLLASTPDAMLYVNQQGAIVLVNAEVTLLVGYGGQELVGNDGGGISTSYRNQVFEPFFTTKVGQHGVGLGLPLSKKIIEDHDGRIEMERVEGVGTTVRIILPLAKGS